MTDDPHFRRSSSKSLLKWFLLNRRVRVASYELCGLLWPARRPDATARMLHVTMHDLRRALEPNLVARQASRFVCSDRDGRHWFDDHDQWWIDIEHVKHRTAAAAAAAAAGDAETAIAVYEEVAAYHESTFLPEDVYNDAFAVARSSCQVSANEVQGCLLVLYLEHGLEHKALTLGMAALETSPVVEVAALAVAEVHLRQGNVLMARMTLAELLLALDADGATQPSQAVLELWRRVEQDL